MRRTSALRPPDYSNRKDEVLLRHGIPDTLMLCHGHQFYVHSEILCTYSPVLAVRLAKQNVDPIWGKTVRMNSSPEFGPRTPQGVVAMLCAIYPPQVAPAIELLREVDSIARELHMTLLLAKLKVGIASNESVLRDFAAAGSAVEEIPEVVLEALAEFRLEDVKAMPGYEDLPMAACVEVSRRRVALLEQTMQGHAVLRACMSAHTPFFAACPSELLRQEHRDHEVQDEEAFPGPVSRANPPWRGAAVVLSITGTGTTQRASSAGRAGTQQFGRTLRPEPEQSPVGVRRSPSSSAGGGGAAAARALSMPSSSAFSRTR
ncbi:unnamed protein product [Polarella glacialis]|uniref:BTB domain-containing protein n=1 Tax=Polarella glacialis TaxID=89957 RepID=A0A813K4Y5_POLGL|nr:unnamed protein product [Polarella glacialis]